MQVESDYYNYILDDSDGESSLGDNGGEDEGAGAGEGRSGGYLDTQWITDIEHQILLSEYEPFLKTDIIYVSFQFVYLDQDKKCIQHVLPLVRPYQYVLNTPNQISQAELLRIIHQYQSVRNKKKYYNFYSMLLYDFQMPDSNNTTNNDVRWLSEYLGYRECEGCGGEGGNINNNEYGRVIEYKNILSFDAIYFRPLIDMFHDLISFTVLLYED